MDTEMRTFLELARRARLGVQIWIRAAPSFVIHACARAAPKRSCVASASDTWLESPRTIIATSIRAPISHETAEPSTRSSADSASVVLNAALAP
eukprot:6185174-Pleurochrysis_carterae.AAC.2